MVCLPLFPAGYVREGRLFGLSLELCPKRFQTEPVGLGFKLVKRPIPKDKDASRNGIGYRLCTATCASLRSWAPPPFGRRPGEWVILVLPEAPTGALPRLPGDSLGVDSGAPGGSWARLPGDALGVDFGAPGGGWARLPGDALGVDFGAPGGENVGKKMQQEAN